MGRNLLLLLGATAVSLALVELALRLVYDDMPSVGWARTGFCWDAAGLRIMRPGTRGIQLGEWGEVVHEANDRGYRDEPWATQREPFRVLLLGDSYGFGWGVPADSTLARRIEEVEGVAAFNLSIPGDGPVTMMERYHRHRDGIDPQLVVMLAYTNDFFGAGAKRRSLAEMRRDPPAPSRGAETCGAVHRGREAGRLDALYLYRLLNRVRIMGGLSFSSDDRRRKALEAGFAPDAEFFGSAAGVEDAVALYRDILTGIRADQPVLLASIPSAYRIDAGWRERVGEVHPGLVAADLDALDRGLERLCDELGVPFVRLADALERAVESGRPLYFEGDAHLTPYGQTVAGERVADAIGRIARAAASIPPQ